MKISRHNQQSNFIKLAEFLPKNTFNFHSSHVRPSLHYKYRLFISEGESKTVFYTMEIYLILCTMRGEHENMRSYMEGESRDYKKVKSIQAV